MASLHIEVSTTNRFNSKVRSIVDRVRADANDMTAILAICNSFLGASPNLALDTTYADLAIALGFTGATANADARSFYTILVAAQNRFTGAQISAFIDNLG